MPTYAEIVRRQKILSADIGTVVTVTENVGTVLLENGKTVHVRYIEA